MTAVRTILIIDEDASYRDVLDVALRKAGHRVIAVADVDAALARLDVEPAPPSLILFAWAMPVAKSLELFGAIAGDARRASIPIVVLSDAASAARIPANASVVLGRPVRLRTLLFVVARLSGATDVPTPIVRRGRGRPTQLIRKWVARADSVSGADTERHDTPVLDKRAS